MKVVIGDTFTKSLKRLIAAEEKWWTFVYWQHKWYGLRNAVWALRKHFKVIKDFTPWDYRGMLETMKLQTELIRNQIETHGLEVEETRLPKIEKMNRFIELINNSLEDNYAERCGYKFTDFDFVETEDSKDKPEDDKMFEMVSKDKVQEKLNSEALKKGRDLKKEEWEEFTGIMRDEMESWWD